jgi:hypothetical protein
MLNTQTKGEENKRLSISNKISSYDSIFNFYYSVKLIYGEKMLKKFFLFAVVAGFSIKPTIAQSPIDIYGYAQASYLFFHNTYDPYPPSGEQNYKYHNMGLDQLNLFAEKDLGGNFSAFINFEFINNYSSDKGFGSFNLQEIYLKWDFHDYLKVKFGVVIPQFNAMFEIYNRTPLLPYLIRPKLYDANGGNLVDIFNILPQKALIQVYGIVPIDAVNIEYAVFAGNPPNSFISSPSNNLLPGYVAYGESAVAYASYGGRIGIKTGGLRAGVSVSFDTDNLENFVMDENGDAATLGDLNRYRFGSDFDFKFNNFELSAEYLIVKTVTPASVQDSLNLWSLLDPYFIGNSFDKKFYYATLLYNFSDELFGYVMYDYLNDSVDPYYFGLDGYYGYHLGGGYYLTDNVIFKVQFTRNFARFNTGEDVIPIRNYSENNYTVGVSISF